MIPQVKFRRLPHAEGLPLPDRASKGAAGLDLRSAESVVLEPGMMASVACGFEIELPWGCVGLVRGRSGLAFRKSVFCFDGTIDADFRGELRVLMFHAGVSPGESSLVINRGDRIAQLVIVPVSTPVIVEVSALSETDRGRGGFGSTGV